MEIKLNILQTVYIWDTSLSWINELNGRNRKKNSHVFDSNRKTSVLRNKETSLVLRHKLLISAIVFMLGICLIDHIKKMKFEEEQKLKMVPLQQRQSGPGQDVRQNPKRWTKIWRLRLHKCNIRRPQKSWVDDIKEGADKGWYQTAQHRKIWKTLDETYVQKWT